MALTLCSCGQNHEYAFPTRGAGYEIIRLEDPQNPASLDSGSVIYRSKQPKIVSLISHQAKRCAEKPHYYE